MGLLATTANFDRHASMRRGWSTDTVIDNDNQISEVSFYVCLALIF